MRIRCRPQADFPAEFSAVSREPVFRSGWTKTLQLLERELFQLDATEVVIELDIGEGEIRQDGFPYADARPGHPGVIISFDSKHGPLRYGTDAFPHWQDNVRAIALGLESLRRVERYGIGKRGEQYVGWKALPAGEDQRRARGLELIEEHGGVTEALKATHPDHGGEADDFDAVQVARG